MSWIWSCFAGLGSGVLGAMGMGGGGVLIIYLTMIANVEQSRAQGINLIFFIPIATLALFIYWKQGLISWKNAIPAAIMGIVGAIIGAFVSSMIDSSLLSKIFAGLLFVMGAIQIFTKPQKKSA